YAQLLRDKVKDVIGKAATLDEAVTALRGEADRFFSRDFLLPRPILEAVMSPGRVVLLIDEIDRADEEFEAYLLEILSDFQITIPELGTVRATSIPHVILTSNRTRELSDALRRRCLFFWLPYPSLEEEIAILHARIPRLSEHLAGQIARAMQAFRAMPLQKAPGVAESLDWASALMSLHRDHLDAATLEQTLGCVLKVREDHGVLASERGSLDPIIGRGPAELEPGGRSLQTDFGLGSVSRPVS
ncbi:MAG TPA: MoxR family ATPase, partial [Vicinamibacterales bacterium]|nr:MoxR family ATPase [Vicinamibacterales bacterium]